MELARANFHRVNESTVKWERVMTESKSNPSAETKTPTISGIHDLAAALARIYAARRPLARRGTLHRV